MQTSQKRTIHCIGTSPFFMMYWTPEQVAIQKYIAENDPEYAMGGDVSGVMVVQIDKILDCTSSDGISYLIKLMHTSQKGTIRCIGASPFFVMYWTPEQVAIYKYITENDAEYAMGGDESGGIVWFA